MEQDSRFSPSLGNAQNAPFQYQNLQLESPGPISGDFSFAGRADRRLANSRPESFHQPEQPPHTPISINDSAAANVYYYSYDEVEKFTDASERSSFVFRSARSGNKHIRKLFVLISLNVAYSSAELCIGLFSGQVCMMKSLQ